MEKKINPIIIRVNVDRLFLDAKNPRLPEDIKSNNQDKIWEHMKNSYNLHELALSITNNGYFEAEPLVAIPKEKIVFKNTEKYDKYRKNDVSEYIVVEGNRRLATIKGLLNGKLKDGNSNYDVSAELKEQFQSLPVLFYPNRDEVLAFLGVHHLAGVRKWDVYERARYIAYLKDEKKYSIDDIQKIIGDRQNSARRIYICYRIVKQFENYNENFGTKDVKKNFSLLLLATKQYPLREYIGFNNWNNIQDITQPITKEYLSHLEFLFECIFDSRNKRRLIKESRDITGKLKHIFGNGEAIRIFKDTGDIELAYEMSDGEIEGLIKIIGKAQKNIEFINGKVSGMTDLTKERREQIKSKIDSIKQSINIIWTVLNDGQ